MTDLQDKRVLITGGAQGIGLEMALKFAGRGAEIVIADLNEAKLGEATAKIEAAGAAAWGFPVDVTDPASIAALRAKIAAEAGPIDLLVNNAGVVFGGPFIETPLERHFKTYEVNVLGVVAMTHAFLSDLIDRPESHIVHISSASGLVGLPFGSTYASSKWAVIGFSESIRAELRLLGHKHVHSTVVCPSYIGTGMFEGAEAPKATSILDPTHLAEKVVRGVERNRVQVLEPWMVKITPLLRELLPTAIYDKVAHLFGADTSMAQWTGHGGSAKPEAQAQPESRDQADAERQ
ncbi:MAG: SDR family oxidoreductase [Deltaproteobacteria bacterium]|nr:SDR family oxidoreductase [Deltaproteobacteria bacterium]MBW2402685.1 SDR family oxidoreductase [Deltaproteobacteria bacterium]